LFFCIQNPRVNNSFLENLHDCIETTLNTVYSIRKGEK